MHVQFTSLALSTCKHIYIYTCATCTSSKERALRTACIFFLTHNPAGVGCNRETGQQDFRSMSHWRHSHQATGGLCCKGSTLAPAADLPASSQPPAATTIIFQPTADLPVAYSASIFNASATADLPVAYSASISHANATAYLPVAYSGSISHANATADLPVSYSASISHANATADLPVAYSGSIGKCFLSPCCLSTGRACAELFPEASDSGRADRDERADISHGNATAALSISYTSTTTIFSIS